MGCLGLAVSGLARIRHATTGARVSARLVPSKYADTVYWMYTAGHNELLQAALKVAGLTNAFTKDQLDASWLD